MAIIKNGVIYDVETIIEKVQSDWNQENPDALDFIKNKPDVLTNNTVLGEDVTAAGVIVGNVKSGDTITAGSSLADILKQILRKVVTCVVNANPTVSFKVGNKGATTYEVGTVLPSQSLSTTISNTGSYKSADNNVYTLKKGVNISTQPPQEVDAVNGILNAQCSINGDPSYSLSDNRVSINVDTQNKTIDGFTVIEGTNVTVNESCTVSSNIVPYNNANELVDNIRFNGYNPGNKAITISGGYKYFYGTAPFIGDGSVTDMSNWFSDTETLSSMTAHGLTSDWCTVNGSTTVGGTSYTTPDTAFIGTNAKPCLVLVLPSKYNTIYETWDALTKANVPDIQGTPNSTWKLQKTITYKVNENDPGTTYYAYAVSLKTPSNSYYNIKFRE